MKEKLLSYTNRIVAVFLLFFGVFVLIYSLLELPFGSFSKPNSEFIPVIFSSGLILFSLISVVLEFCQSPKIPRKFVDLNWKKVSFYYLECIVYVLLIDKVGFLIDTILILFVMLKQCGVKGWVKPLVITLITAFAIWAIFTFAMKIMLPHAIWF